jgi:KUP system potassium uptake protein
VLEKHLSDYYKLTFFERLIMRLYLGLKEISLSEGKGFGLDPGNVAV